MRAGHQLPAVWISALLVGAVISSWGGFSRVPLLLFAVVVVGIRRGSGSWEPRGCGLESGGPLGGGSGGSPGGGCGGSGRCCSGCGRRCPGCGGGSGGLGGGGGGGGDSSRCGWPRSRGGGSSGGGSSSCGCCRLSQYLFPPFSFDCCFY